MPWEQLVPFTLGLIGAAGVGGLVTSISQLTRPSRLRRRAERFAAVRDVLPEDSSARQRLDSAIEETADKLVSAGATWRAMRDPVLITLLVASVSSIVAVVALAVAEDRESSSLVGITGTIAIVAVMISVPVLAVGAIVAAFEWRSRVKAP